jgi:hypothetical protein
MIQDLAEYDLTKHEFKANLKWFEEEFDELFLPKSYHLSPMDIKLANEILDLLSQMINECHDEELLFELVEILNKLEKNHPALFSPF